jgi:hypothetical protein
LGGQRHRLIACIETGIAFDIIAVTGVAPEARQTIDLNKSRSMGDMVDIDGSVGIDGITAAATIRALHRIRSRGGVSALPAEWDAEMDPTDAHDVIRAIAAESQLIQAGLAATKQIPTKWIGRGSAAAMWIEFSRAATEKDANEFWDAVATGAGLDRDDVRLALRNRFATVAEVGYRSGSGLRSAELRERIVIRSWNRWMEGKPAVRRGGVPAVQLGRNDLEAGSCYPVICGVAAS